MTIGEAVTLTGWNFAGKVISLLFNTLSRFIIALLPGSKHVLISWLQSPSTLSLESKKIISNLNLRGSNNLSEIFPFSYQQRFSSLIGVDVSVKKIPPHFSFLKSRTLLKVHLFIFLKSLILFENPDQLTSSFTVASCRVKSSVLSLNLLFLVPLLTRPVGLTYWTPALNYLP